MYIKSLVSIYFLENVILISELDSKKKSVKYFGKVELPEGVIRDYKVKDVTSLSVVLRNSFAQLGITEKSIGIVVPEFATFSKLIRLPKLAVGELNEAVLWQAQEFLPDGSENMIIDWKIAERNESETNVLISAIPRDVLVGYVEACEKAGLFPRGVQTPSIVLTNLTTKEDGGYMIYYSGFGETILIINHKDKILGTSVNKDTDENEGVETAVKMINHYKQVEVKKVFVCGKDGTAGLLTGLKNKLNIPAIVLDSGMKGRDQARLEELIIPLSMLHKDLEEPSSSKTINLLPLTLVEKYKSKKSKVEIWTLTLTVTLFVWFCFLIVLGSYLIISQQINSLKTLNLSGVEQVSKIQKYEIEAKKINDTSQKVLKIKSAFISPQEVLNVITEARTPGLSIDNYKIDFDKGMVSLNGVSSDRDALLNFKDNLEKSSKVSNVSVPISSFERISNLEFTLGFTYGDRVPVINSPKINIENN